MQRATDPCTQKSSCSSLSGARPFLASAQGTRVYRTMTRNPLAEAYREREHSKLCHNGGRERKGQKMRKKQSEKGRQTSHGELHANESETICKRAFISLV